LLLLDVKDVSRINEEAKKLAGDNNMIYEERIRDLVHLENELPKK
jgi:hypothetical protein